MPFLEEGVFESEDTEKSSRKGPALNQLYFPGTEEHRRTFIIFIGMNDISGGGWMFSLGENTRDMKMIQGKEGSDHDGPWMVSVGNRTMALKDIHVLILGTYGWIRWHGQGELTDGIRGTNRLTLRWRHYPELSRWAPWNHTFLWVEERSRKIERTREMAVWGRPSLMLLVLKMEKEEASQGMEWPLEDGRDIDRWVEMGASGEVQPDPSSSGVWVSTSKGLLPRGQGPGLFCSGISQSLNTGCPREWRRHSQASLD